MQLVLRIIKASISMNNWVIFFHFEMWGIEVVLKLWYMKHSEYMGKYSHGSSLHYISLFTGFLQVK